MSRRSGRFHRATKTKDVASVNAVPRTAAPVGNANADKSLQPCARCGEWTPHALSLRRLAQSVGGVTHIVAESDYGTKVAIMNKADLLGLTTDTGDKALSPWKVKTTLRGRRLLVIATGWPPLRIARLIKLCILLYSPEGRWTATLGDAALVYVADIGAVAEAQLFLEAGGVDTDAMREALKGGFADSTILQQHGSRMARRDFGRSVYFSGWVYLDSNLYRNNQGARCKVKYRDFHFGTISGSAEWYSAPPAPPRAAAGYDV